MIKSSKARYQRRFRFNAPMHQRQHFLHVHLDKALRKRLKLSKRAIQLSRGDTVKVMSGKRVGTSGKVTSVSLRTGRITIDSLTRKTARGKEIKVPISAWNVYITDINLTDRGRAAKLKLTPTPKEVPKPAPQKPQENAPAAEAKSAESAATVAAKTQ